MIIPKSISDSYYVYGSSFFYILTLAASVTLGLLAWSYSSWLLALAAIEVPMVWYFGDFNGKDRFGHFFKAGLVFIPMLLFIGWKWLAAGIAFAGLGFLTGKYKLLIIELLWIIIFIYGLTTI